jgi:AcrR family transcriptional regulator
MSATGTAKPLRADAQRNRDAVLGAARHAFESDGISAPLDTIAARAGVGNATLYRNFATREDLLAAVIEREVAELMLEGDEAARSLEPGEAFQEWLFRLTWRLRIWNDLPTCIADATDGESPLRQVSSTLLERTGRFLQTARAAGAVRDGFTAQEVFELVTAAAWAVDRFGDDEPAARRRVLLATAGVVARP